MVCPPAKLVWEFGPTNLTRMEQILDWYWPMLTEGYEKQRVWDILNDRDTAIPTHNFLWEDPEVKAADELFMKTKWSADKLRIKIQEHTRE